MDPSQTLGPSLGTEMSLYPPAAESTWVPQFIMPGPSKLIMKEVLFGALFAMLPHILLVVVAVLSILTLSSQC